MGPNFCSYIEWLVCIEVYVCTLPLMLISVMLGICFWIGQCPSLGCLAILSDIMGLLLVNWYMIPRGAAWQIWGPYHHKRTCLLSMTQGVMISLDIHWDSFRHMISWLLYTSELGVSWLTEENKCHMLCYLQQWCPDITILTLKALRMNKVCHLDYIHASISMTFPCIGMLPPTRLMGFCCSSLHSQ